MEYAKLGNSRFKLESKTKNIINIILCLLACIGLYLYIKNGVHNYMLFKAAFAFFDYSKSALLVFIENILMMILFVFIGSCLAKK